jgi:hypothetical protein
MTVDGQACFVPCRECGASLPLEIASGISRCDFCRREQQLDGPVLERAREHLRRLTELEIAASADLAEGTYWRGLRRPVLLIGLGANAALLGLALLGVAMSNALERRSGGRDLGNACGRVTALTSFACRLADATSAMPAVA